METDNDFFPQSIQIDLREITLPLYTAVVFPLSPLGKEVLQALERVQKICLTNIKYEMNVHTAQVTMVLSKTTSLFSLKNAVVFNLSYLIELV